MKNLFDTKGIQSGEKEIFEPLLSSQGFKIERIVTLEPYTKPGEWYDQELDEWVTLLQGTAVLEFKDEKKINLISGDHIFIPAHKIHRINQSGMDEKCIWLAIHGKLK